MSSVTKSLALHRARRAERSRLALRTGALQGVLILWTLASVLPVAWMFSASLQTNQEIYQGVHFIPKSFTLENFVQAWVRASFSTYSLNSLFYTVVVVAGVVILASMSAFAFARLRFPGKNLLYFAFLIFIFIPIPGSFIPLYVLLVKLGIVNTRIGYILPLIQGSLTVAIFILRSFFEDIPREIEEAARMDGASWTQTFWRISVPIAKPAIATIIIFTALGVWNEYLLASIVFSDTQLMPLQAGIMRFQGSFFSQYGLMMAALSITTIPIVVLYGFMQRYIIKGVMAGAVKG